MINQGKDAPLAILFRVEAKPGKRQKLLDFLQWDCAVCAELERKTLRFDVLQDPAAENAFFVYEAYENADAFDEHTRNAPYLQWRSEEFQAEVVAGGGKDLFQGAPECLFRRLA